MREPDYTAFTSYSDKQCQPSFSHWLEDCRDAARARFPCNSASPVRITLNDEFDLVAFEYWRDGAPVDAPDPQWPVTTQNKE